MIYGHIHNIILSIHFVVQISVSINGACLHPKYGEKTPKELMEELEQYGEDSHDEVLKKLANSKRINQARRSPYPTLVIEIQASPPLPVVFVICADVIVWVPGPKLVATEPVKVDISFKLLMLELV